MTAKQWLNRARKIDDEINGLLETKKATKERLQSITQNYNGDNITSTKDPHKFDSLVELESLIDSKIDEQLKIKAEIMETIMQLPNVNHRMALTMHYINMQTWEQVAVNMNYTWRHVMNIHGTALLEVEKILRKENIA